MSMKQCKRTYYALFSGHFMMAVMTVPGTDDFFTIDPCNAFEFCHVWKVRIFFLSHATFLLKIKNPY